LELKDLPDWESFETSILTAFREIQERRIDSPYHISTPIFRGQEDAAWQLTTTLDRLVKKPFSLRKYWHVMGAALPKVNSFTQEQWALDKEYVFDESSNFPPPGYEFMAYLRHHNFPSPLLDWTRSPFIAAFFAFRPVPYDEQTEKVAIFSYQEYSAGGKGWTGGDPAVFGLGSYITTHKRHFMQQSEYTICKIQSDNGYLYCPHEDAFKNTHKDQDILIKYLIPRSERSNVLKRLEMMNINSYSLFGSEEGLMDLLAYQELEKNHPEP